MSTEKPNYLGAKTICEVINRIHLWKELDADELDTALEVIRAIGQRMEEVLKERKDEILRLEGVISKRDEEIADLEELLRQIPST